MVVCPPCNNNNHHSCVKKRQTKGSKLTTVVDCSCNICWTSEGEAIFGIVMVDENAYTKNLIARFT